MAGHSFFVVSFVSFNFWGMSFGGWFVEERLNFGQREEEVGKLEEGKRTSAN